MNLESKFLAMYILVIYKICPFNFCPVLPAVPVAILIGVGDIYGVREVKQDDDPSDPYLM